MTQPACRITLKLILVFKSWQLAQGKINVKNFVTDACSRYCSLRCVPVIMTLGRFRVDTVVNVRVISHAIYLRDNRILYIETSCIDFG
jgi:hypothetical protein